MLRNAAEFHACCRLTDRCSAILQDSSDVLCFWLPQLSVAADRHDPVDGKRLIVLAAGQSGRKKLISRFKVEE